MLYKPQSTVIRAHTNIREGTSNLCIKSTKSETDKKKKKKGNTKPCALIWCHKFENSLPANTMLNSE